MNKIIAKRFYNSKKWKTTQELKMKQSKYLCEMCLKEGKLERAINVHHKIELTDDNINDPRIAYNLDNLICLCIHHHNVIHGRERERRYKIDKNGDVII